MKYIFITFSIINIGGSQLYVRNKAKWLREQGWDVEIWSSMEGNVCIPELVGEQKHIIHDLAYPPQFLRRSKQNKIIDLICNETKQQESIIVESHSTVFGLWGEKIAKKLHAKHLLNSLEENNRVLSHSHFGFIKYKWEHKALCGIFPTSIDSFFKKYKFIITPEKSYYLNAHCSNPVDDVPYNISLIEGAKTIILFGRLNKPFMPESAKSISEYLKKKHDDYFNVIIIGGAGDFKSYKKLFAEINNCNLIMTGNLFPVPYSLLSKADVVVASAGCVRVSYNLGIPTISIDGNDLQPIGIMGFSTTQTLFRDKEPIIPLGVLLDKVLYEGCIEKHLKPFSPVEFEFSEHIRFVNSMVDPYSYYDTDKITFNFKNKCISRAKRILYNLIGYSNYSKLSKYI